MNYRVLQILTTLLFMLASFSAEAVVPVKPIQQDTLLLENNLLRADVPQAAVKNTRKERRFQKRIERFKKRLFKKNNSFGDIFNSSKFRLGAILFLMGIAMAVVFNILSIAGLLGWLAGVVAVIGVVYMVWGLIEYSS